jgi:WD40 repeat protein
MVTGSNDKRDLETGVVLKKMEGHSSLVLELAVSRDGQIIASGDWSGEIIACHGEIGESLIKPIKAYKVDEIKSVDFSPDCTVLATSGSHRDSMTKFWCTKTWQMQGDPIKCGAYCIGYSPSGEFFAIATYYASKDIQIYNSATRERVASFKLKGHTKCNLSLAWMPDGTRLLSGGDEDDPTIREWDSSTWEQVGLPWKGHTRNIYAIAIDPTGTLVASASSDRHVRLWRLSDQRNVGISKHSWTLRAVTFSVDGTHILGGGYGKKISEWEVPKGARSKASFYS